VTIDFAKRVVSVRAKGSEVGALSGPVEEFLLDLGLGGGPVVARVRLASSGARRAY
jgi:hypothetical protein